MGFLNYDMCGERITADNFDTVLNAVTRHCLENYNLTPGTLMFGDAMLPVFAQIQAAVLARFFVRIEQNGVEHHPEPMRPGGDGEIGRYATNYGILKLVHEHAIGNDDIIITHANVPEYTRPARIWNFRL